MKADGADVHVLDLDPTKPLPASEAQITLKDDPLYSKYFKMLSMRIPRGAGFTLASFKLLSTLTLSTVEQKMRADGIDAAILDLDPEKPVSQQALHRKPNLNSELPSRRGNGPISEDHPLYEETLHKIAELSQQGGENLELDEAMLAVLSSKLSKSEIDSAQPGTLSEMFAFRRWPHQAVVPSKRLKGVYIDQVESDQWNSSFWSSIDIRGDSKMLKVIITPFTSLESP